MAVLLFIRFMKFFALLLTFFRRNEPKTLAEYQQEMYTKWGKKQFEKLNKLGLSISVSLA
jgi:hypothetical protein